MHAVVRRKTPIGRRLDPYHGDIVERAAAHGMPGAVVDGRMSGGFMPRLERRWRAGLSSRIATISVPFASYGVAGHATLRPAVMHEPGLARLPVLGPGWEAPTGAEEPWAC